MRSTQRFPSVSWDDMREPAKLGGPSEAREDSAGDSLPVEVYALLPWDSLCAMLHSCERLAIGGRIARRMEAQEGAVEERIPTLGT